VLNRLAEEEVAAADPAKLRYFVGTSMPEAIEAMNSPLRDAKRLWAFASARLRHALERSGVTEIFPKHWWGLAGSLALNGGRTEYEITEQPTSGVHVDRTPGGYSKCALSHEMLKDKPSTLLLQDHPPAQPFSDYSLILLEPGRSGGSIIHCAMTQSSLIRRRPLA